MSEAVAPLFAVGVCGFGSTSYVAEHKCGSGFVLQWKEPGGNTQSQWWDTTLLAVVLVTFKWAKSFII